MINSIVKNLPRWTPISGSLIAFIVVVLILTPVLLNQLPPIHDYSHHLSRIIILSDLENPVYNLYYQQGSLLLPNMAMEIIAIPLAHFVGAETASRFFVMLSLLSVLFGTMMLHKAAHKRFSPWPLLASAILFNTIFRFGFLNYIFGLGIAFFAAGLWLLMKPSFFRLLFTLLASILLIFLHFSAFGVFAVIVGSIEIHAASVRWQHKDFKFSTLQLLVSTTPFIITFALFMFFSPTAEIIDKGFSYPNYLGAKPFGALYSILTDITWLNIVYFSSMAVIFSFLLLTRRINISSSLSLALLVMIAALIMLPSSAMGNVFVDVRLGPVITLLFIATIDIKATDININRFIACLAVILATLTSVGMNYKWGDYNHQVSKIIKVFDQTETGATIFSASSLPDPKLITDTPERRAAWNPSLKHIASYAVMYGPKFVPMTFANPQMQPLNVSGDYLAIKAFQGDNPRKTLNGSQLEIFLLEIKANLASGIWPTLDNVYVFVIGFDRIEDSFNKAMLGSWAHIVELKDGYVLIKIKKGSLKE